MKMPSQPALTEHSHSQASSWALGTQWCPRQPKTPFHEERKRESEGGELGSKRCFNPRKTLQGDQRPLTQTRPRRLVAQGTDARPHHSSKTPQRLQGVGTQEGSVSQRLPGPFQALSCRVAGWAGCQPREPTTGEPCAFPDGHIPGHIPAGEPLCHPHRPAHSPHTVPIVCPDTLSCRRPRPLPHPHASLSRVGLHKPKHPSPGPQP